MAAGALRKSGADFSLAISGVAGPDGGSSEKPVGTVWIALGMRGAGEPFIKTEYWNNPGDRAAIRDRAAKAALNLLRNSLAAKSAAWQVA